MQKQFEQVREFQKTFNLPAAPVSMIPDVDRCGLRISLIEEEFDEVCEAIAMGDRKNIAKELADLLYVVLGTMIDFGMNATREDYIPMPGTAQIKYVEMNIGRLQDGIKENSLRDVFVALGDLAKYVFDFVEHYDFIDQFDEIFDETHKSNMSKACRSHDEAIETLEHWETNEEKGKPLCEIIQYSDFYLVKRLSDGKLMKSINYHPARIGGLI